MRWRYLLMAMALWAGAAGCASDQTERPFATEREGAPSGIQDDWRLRRMRSADESSSRLRDSLAARTCIEGDPG